ncbi:hypothetical protein [Haloarcula marina]|uniref:hypothetical protein n=1 Tax=Haloarcula marina TaxID=2961574 RepID=UPI0020B85EAA|nr:hypothetical protein [Halomicroarcula marina]
MNGECYFCHGLVLAGESEDIVLDSHADHDVFLHRQCAVGHNVVEQRAGPSGDLEILCPECGEVEVR